MDLEAKKGILLSIIAATEKVSVIDHLITVAWQKEMEGGKTILQKEGKNPKQPRGVIAITIHGQQYRSLRYACLEVWGMTPNEYQKLNKQVVKGVDIHDLLAPRRDPERKILPTDENGVVLMSKEK